MTSAQTLLRVARYRCGATTSCLHTVSDNIAKPGAPPLRSKVIPHNSASLCPQIGLPTAMPTHAFTPRYTAFTHRIVHGMAWVLAAMLLGGCASQKLPTHVDRPVSTAVTPAASSPLVQISLQRKQAENKAGAEASGFEILAGAQSAYGARLALVQGAQQTLDLQYYAIHADASTARLLDAVVQAARRGVRVRVLLDDFHGTGRNAQVMRLAFEPHIEMRMFNPLPGSRDSALSRMWNAATDFQRAQQRMHNKLFLADNVMGVMGGRNLGDAYFDNDAGSNFLDTDVLAMGPVVRDLSKSFDSYWNNERAYPVQSLSSKDELEAMHKNSSGPATKDAPSADPSKGNRPKPPDGEPRPTGDISDAQRARAWDRQALDLRTVPLVWARAVMMADAPSKIPAVDSDGHTAPLTATPGVQESQRLTQLRALAPDKTSNAAPPASTTSTAPDGTESLVDGLVHLLGYAQKDLLIVSPYFVPGDSMRQAFQAAVKRGVRVRVLTNSLASNDAPLAHIGYARYREEMLRDGVELYELVSDSSNLRAAFGMGSGQGGFRDGKRNMLHSKMLVLDGQLFVIGSMNLDQRSKLQNTEIAVLVRSRKLSGQATEMVEKGLHQGAWHVVLKDGALQWIAPQGSQLENATSDPDTSLPLRWMLKIISPLAPDSML